MKTSFTIFLLCVWGLSASGQITYVGCSDLITTGPSSYTLQPNGTTDDNGTIRNSFAAMPTSCSAGVCNFTMSWNAGQSRWEFILPGAGVLHYSDVASVPNPPNLTLGNWQNEQGCSGITTWSGDVQASEVLPVELLSFRVYREQESPILYWQTAFELNNEGFEIEESKDGRDFYKIGFVEGVGSTDDLQEYAFEIKEPEEGIKFFRLKQMDYDGQFKYSNIISLNTVPKTEQVGEFYPNPSLTGEVSLNYNTQEEDVLTIAVLDLKGKQILLEKKQVGRGGNLLTFDFSALSPGVYITRITEGQNPIYRKLFIKFSE